MSWTIAAVSRRLTQHYLSNHLSMEGIAVRRRPFSLLNPVEGRCPVTPLLGEQSGHPSRGERRRECKSQGGGRALGSQNALIGVAARKFAAIKNGLQDQSGFRRKFAEAGFLFRPQKDAGSKPVRLHERFHERDLVNASAARPLVADSYESDQRSCRGPKVIGLLRNTQTS